MEFRRHVNYYHEDEIKSNAFVIHATPIFVDVTNLICKLCTTLQDSLLSLAEHLRAVHNLYYVNSKVIDCFHATKLGKDTFDCVTCGKSFTCYKELSDHLHAYISLGPVLVLCDTCGKAYRNNDDLRRHVEEKHDSLFKCRRCKQKFSTRQARIKHVNENKNCWPFSCPTCKERFPFWEPRQAHLEQIHGAEKLIFPCKECGLVFEKRIQMYFHYKRTHTDDLKCSVCDDIFYTKNQLIDHGFTHTGERPYKCAHCDASFAKNRSLKVHSKIHDDTTKISCPVCGKLFVARSKIKMHVSKHHPDIFQKWALGMNFKL